KRKSDDIEVYRRRANAYLRTQYYRESIADFNKIIQLNPLDTSVYYEIGIVYFKAAEYDQSIDSFRKALVRNPDLRTDYLSTLADAYFFRGQLALIAKKYLQAIADYDEAINIKPFYFQAFYERGEAYLARGQKEEAIADFKKVLMFAPRNDSFYKEAEKQLKKLKAK
ncbi:MAG TPA: tetratricopeptide repeat protein, partial [Acidobacteriota bacterium]|nr:tetratricopeptide repeat protein [Acidobacteriota bacterium]